MAEEDSRKILLHACCAPCSSAIVEHLVLSGVHPVVFYSNANIFPEQEYCHRRDECVRYARESGLEIVDDVYDHAAWQEWISGLENEPERGARCLRAARYAAENGFDTLATTLASSRWKNLDQVNEAGFWACGQVEGVAWWPRNWRKGGLQERRNALIREKHFYNQLYCGCEFSMNNKALQK